MYMQRRKGVEALRCISSESRRKKAEERKQKLFIVTNLFHGWISHARDEINVKSWCHLVFVLAPNCTTILRGLWTSLKWSNDEIVNKNIY